MPPLISFVVAGSTDADPLLGPELAEAEVVRHDAGGGDRRVRVVPGRAAAAGRHRQRGRAPARRGARTCWWPTPALTGGCWSAWPATAWSRSSSGRGWPGWRSAAATRCCGASAPTAWASPPADLAWPALLTAERIVAAPGARCATSPDVPSDDHAAVVRLPRRAPGAAGGAPQARRAGDPPARAGRPAHAARRRARRSLRRADRGCAAPPRDEGRGGRRRPPARLVARGSYRRFPALEASRRARRTVDSARGGAPEARGRRAQARRLERDYRKARAAADRRAPGRVRRLLVPRLLVQPARDLREGARARAGPARRVGGAAGGGGVAAAPASSTSLPGTREYFDVLARARVLVNNVNFPNHYVKRDGQT